MTPDLKIKIGKLELKNPVMVASGTFGYAQEFKDFLDLKKLGAIVTKTITLKPRKGNPMPRTCETPAGMLNAIGLENPGLEVFLEKKLPLAAKYGVAVIVSIASEGDSREFAALAERLDRVKEVAAIELNISCPNIGPHVTSPATKSLAGRHKSQVRKLVAQDAQATAQVVRSVRRATGKTIITKLSPNVTDISEIARAAEEAGSDAVSLINTLTGMSVDINKRTPRLANICGGLSGPAIRPIAVRMVWEVSRAVKIPIIGMGGIMNTMDALEFIIAGATAVSVGTANFVDPMATIKIINGIKEFMRENKTAELKELIGSLKV